MKIRFLSHDARVFLRSSPARNYWVGFLLADGCVIVPPSSREQRRLSVWLAVKDRQHVEALLRFLRSDCPLKFRKPHGRPVCGRMVHSDGAYGFDFSAGALVASLARLGVVPRKTKVAKAVGALAHDRHFWRGVVDGDGTVGLNANGKPYLSLCGTRRLMEQFLTFVRCVDPKVTATVQPASAGICFTLRVNCTAAQHVVRELYRGRVTALSRKAVAAERVLLWRATRARPGEAVWR